MNDDYEHPEPQPFHDAPRYWRRVYSTAGVPEVEQVGNVTVVTPRMPGDQLVIFGYSTRSRYAEDAIGEEDVWNRRRAFPAICFSAICPEGEYGSVAVDDVSEISRDEFEQVRKFDWLEAW